jgi:hypothetical protein
LCSCIAILGQYRRAHVNTMSGKHSARKLNFYFLSTGRCGTRFFSKVLETATNAVVFHQPQPYLADTMRAVVQQYIKNREQFARLQVKDFPQLKEKLELQATYPKAVYGDTLNSMFPFGHLLYQHFGAEKLRLIHLLRNPVDCGRSILKVEREGGGTNFRPRSKLFLEGTTSAERTGHLWNNINNMIKHQFDLINDPSVCETIRLEDVSLGLIRDLFAFLQLEGFDAKRIEALMQDKSPEVRHSHVAVRTDVPDASAEELETIRRITAATAFQFGYGQ